MRNLSGIGASIASTKYANVEIGDTSGLESISAQIAVEAVEIEADMEFTVGLEHVISGLEAIAAEAAGSIVNGGYDRVAAGMMEVAVESHLCIVGLSASDSVPSLESFGSTSTQVEATQVSVEGIKEKAKQLWTFLVKKFKEIREKMLVWYKKIFSGAAMLKKRGEAVAKKSLEKKDGLKDDVEDISLGGAASALMVDDNGNADIPKLKDSVKALTAIGDKIFRGHSGTLSTAADGVEALLSKAAGMDKETFETGLPTAWFKDGDVAGVATPKFIAANMVGDTIYLGGRQMTANGDEATKAADMAALKSNLDSIGLEFNVIKKSEKTVKAADDQKFSALSTGDIKAVAEEVVTLAEAIIAYEGDYFKHQKSVEKADKAAEKFGDAAGKYSLSAGAAAAEKVCKSAYSALQRLNQNPANQFTASAMSSAKAALDVCDKSLGQYK
jgi:hypothetical protein